MIIKSNCIFDSIHDEPFAGYVEVCGQKIVRVSTEQPTSGEAIEDVGNRTVMAGFCDNHVHIFLAALDLATCNLNDTRSEEEAAQRLNEFYKDKTDPFIISFGWCHYNWEGEKLPTKETLDRYFPDRPVVAVNDELHALWVNSKALELCHIDRETKDPAFGLIERDQNGEPTGYILEQSAMTIFTEIAFQFDKAKDKELVKKFIAFAQERGVTSVGDMEIIGILKHDVYEELEKEKQLQLRVFFSPSIKKELSELLQLKEKHHSDCLALLGAKGFIDGTPLGHTGMLVEEYSDQPGFYGEPVLDLPWLEEKVSQLNLNGIPVRLHACGDGAVREALDAIEKAQHQGAEKELRNTIEHIENIHPDDLDRLSSTHTVASIQPYHMSMERLEEHPIFEILGQERSRLAWPAKTLMQHGAHVALGTDCPIVALDPFQTIYCAVNRVMEDGSPEGGWNPQEKLSLAEALKGCTAEVAYLLQQEERIGTLEEGKLADIIVLSDNIFDINPLDIRELTVEKTIFNGEVVYEKWEESR